MGENKRRGAGTSITWLYRLRRQRIARINHLSQDMKMIWDAKFSARASRDTENNDVISPTPYDVSFRTLVIKGGNLIIPFINELFKDNKPIKMDATVFNSANEQFLNLDNGAQEKGQTDSIIYINGEPYHIECQSTDDGTILVRIAKYDWLEAMRTSKIEGNRINIHIPYSGLLYLRKTEQTPGEMYVHYFDNYGHDFEYPVKVINLGDYTLVDLIERNLTFLIPFYLFNLERELKDYEDEVSREKIKSSYNGIFDYLNGLMEEKKISLYQYSLITDVLKKVTDNLAQKNEEARKELDELMGGKILKFKNEELFDEQQFHDIETLMETAHMTPEQAMDALRVSSDKRTIYLKKLTKKKELVEA